MVKQHTKIGSSQNFYQFYTYDDLGRLKKAYVNTSDNRPSTPVAVYHYDAEGKITAKDVNPAIAASTHFEYDEQGRLKHYFDEYGEFDQTITYNTDGTIAGISTTNLPKAYTQNFSYDNLGQLTSADYVNGSENYDVNTISYDKHGNIKTLRRYFDPSMVDHLTYTYGTGTNKLHSVADAVSTTASHDWDAEDSGFSYDLDGNMISSTKDGAPELEDVVYNTSNLPIFMRVRGARQALYQYNARGWRFAREVKDLQSGATTEKEYYILDGNTTLAVTDAGGNVSYWNMYGNELLGRQKANGEQLFYVFDYLGSTRRVYSQGSQSVASYNYYPFGAMMHSSLSEPTKETFTGKELDEETGRYYFGARYYDAALGRWSVTDPAGQFASPYAYAGNPVSYTDPDGEFVGLVLATAAIASTINGIQASRAGAHWTDVISSVTGSFTQTTVIGGFSAGAGSAIAPAATGSAGLATGSGQAAAIAGGAATGVAGAGVGYTFNYLNNGREGKFLPGFGKAVGIGGFTGGLISGLLFELSSAYQLQTHQTVLEYADRRGTLFTKGLNYLARTQGINPNGIEFQRTILDSNGNLADGLERNGKIRIAERAFYESDQLRKISSARGLYAVWHEDFHRQLYFRRIGLNLPSINNDLLGIYEHSIIFDKSVSNFRYFNFVPDIVRNQVINEFNHYNNVLQIVNEAYGYFKY